MEQKHNSYIVALDEIRDHIINLNRFYQWFTVNKSNLNYLFNNDKQRISTSEIDDFYINLVNRVEELKRAVDKIEEVKINLPQKLDSQFDNFLNKELLSIDWNVYNQISKRRIHPFEKFEEVVRKNESLDQEQYKVLDSLATIIRRGKSLETNLINKISSIDIFREMQGLNQNIVMIGANGSGKSRFSRSLEGKLASGISIIPAQKLLVYNNPDHINVNHSMVDKVKEFQRDPKLAAGQNFISLLTNDLQNLMEALLEERLNQANQYYRTDQKKDSLLDKTIEIWESLNTHRKIVHKEKYKIYIETLEGHQYGFNDLSDGEKAIFYYIGHVMLAEKNSYILIDEPENHLHLSICNKLWDELELRRRDCKFIYITHNLNFAVSRNRKSLIWNKSYIPPFNWDFEIVKENEAIPEIMMLEIMGSRKNVLFCEGDDRNSLDYKIYSRLFNNLNVIPVRGHEEVVKYCMAFNRNNMISGLKVYGVIDGDTWTQEEIESKRKDNIYTLPFNEIENIICQKEILKKIAGLVGSDENAVNNFINEFFKEVEKKKEELSVWYANNMINNYLKRNLFKENKSIVKLINEVETILQKEEINKYYKEMLKKIEEDLANHDYNSLLKYVNMKRFLTRALGNKHIVNNFEDRFVNILDINEEFKGVLDELIVTPYLSDLV